jgi:hypothetical protein
MRRDDPDGPERLAQYDADLRPGSAMKSSSASSGHSRRR